MDFYLNLLDAITSLTKQSLEVKESWGFVYCSGDYNSEVFDSLENICHLIEKESSIDILQIRFDSEEVKTSEFGDYKQTPNSFNKWSLNLNKESLVKKTESGFYYNLFTSKNSCLLWFEQLNPLEEGNKVNLFNPLKIIVSDLDKPFGGEFLYFLPLKRDIVKNIEYKSEIKLPDSQKTKENVRFVTNYKTDFDPNTYLLEEVDLNNELCKSMIKASCIVMASCISNEFYGQEKVTLDGLKRISLKLFDDKDIFDFKLNKELILTVNWLYEERISTRKKLFNDRITLELNEENTLIATLKSHMASSLLQAQERYDFVILDRKDAYIKELKDLLKDLRSQSDLYSLKVRTLLSNFLRDLLAAIVLIGFTIFTKFTDNIGLEKNKLLVYVFYGLALYYVISFILQAIIDWTDISVTNNELKYWKKASKELIADKEFDKYYKESLKGRKISLWILYPFIGVLYLSVSVMCYLYPSTLNTLIIKPTNDAILECKPAKSDSTQGRK